MRPLRYSVNVTLDGCCDHRAIIADEELHRHATENLEQADALLFGRVTYEMMEAAWRPPARAGARPDWMEPFARTMDAAKKYVVSNTLDHVDWNAELVRGDLASGVRQLKRESGQGLFVAGVKLAMALAELGLIDEYEFVVHPRWIAPRTTSAHEADRPEARQPAGVRLGRGGDALSAAPRALLTKMTRSVDPTEQLVTEIVVRDIKRSMRFYRALGFELLRDGGDFAELTWEDHRLFLAEPTAFHDIEHPAVPLPPPFPAANVRVMVPNVDDYWKLATELGAKVIVPIADRYYGLRDFTIADPDGFGVRFATALEGS